MSVPQTGPGQSCQPNKGQAKAFMTHQDSLCYQLVK